MMNNKEIKEVIEKFLLAMGLNNPEIKIEEVQPSNSLIFKIYLDNANQFIGAHGNNIFHLEYLIKIIIRKMGQNAPPFILDINDYRKSKEIFLKELAKTIAQKVALSGESQSLPPMPSYERRLIHLELSINPNVITESQGKGTNRYVVVKLNK